MTWPIPPQTLIAYTAAAAALVLLPGPAQALVLTRSVERGARAGILTAAGLDAATLVHTLAATLGLSAILAASAAAFTAVKIAGAAYLIWLGVRMLRATPTGGEQPQSEPTSSRDLARVRDRRLIAHGFATGLLNPKVALFFLAFLPQFVHREQGHVLTQFMVLGAILAALDLVWAALLAVLAARARRRLGQNGRFVQWRGRATGAILIALGLKLAFARR